MYDQTIYSISLHGHRGKVSFLANMHDTKPSKYANMHDRNMQICMTQSQVTNHISHSLEKDGNTVQT